MQSLQLKNRTFTDPSLLSLSYCCPSPYPDPIINTSFLLVKVGFCCLVGGGGFFFFFFKLLGVGTKKVLHNS